ncbi:DUF5372 family protein [Myxococcota bacterium]
MTRESCLSLPVRPASLRLIENHGRGFFDTSWTTFPNAPDPTESGDRVRITHPFHPLSGCELVFVDERRNHHGDRVWYQTERGLVHTVPRVWTSLATLDVFEVISAGRASFRPGDLVDLAALLDALGQQQGDSDEG